MDVAEAYAGADYAVIATPTNYDSDRNFFDTSSVEAAIAAVRSVNPDAWIVIKSTIPVGYTAGLRERLGGDKIFFSPEFLREQGALRQPAPQPYRGGRAQGRPRGRRGRRHTFQPFSLFLLQFFIPVCCFFL